MPDIKNRLSIIVEGRPEDNGDVRLEYFISVLDDWRKLLYEADRLVSGRQSVYYRIVDLKHESPATVVLEPVPLQSEEDPEDYRELVGAAVFRGVQSLQAGGDVEEFYDYPALAAFRAVSLPVGDKVGFTRLVTSLGEVTVGREVATRVDEITSQVDHELGSVTGFVERLNIHGDARIFYLYPNFGPDRVRCTFHPRMRDQVIEAVGRYATVHGRLRYKGRQLYAEELFGVSEIEIHPEESDLPSIDILKDLGKGELGS